MYRSTAVLVVATALFGLDLTAFALNAPAPVITVQPESRTVAEGDGMVFIVVAAGADPLGYQWFKDGVELADATSDVFVLTSVGEADEGSYTVVVDNALESVGSEPAMLSINRTEPGIPVIVAQPESQTVAAGGEVIFTVMAAGAEPLSYQWSKDDVVIDDAMADSLTLMEVSEADVGSYAVVVSNEIGSVTSDPATLTIADASIEALCITLQPESQTVARGADVLLEVLATGNEPLSYQWFKDDVEIEDATASSLHLTGVGAADMGIYTVVVSNEIDSVTSDPADLTVTEGETEGLVIVVQPESQAVAAGVQVRFTVLVTGAEPLSYQWFKDGVEILGATADTLVLGAVSSVDQGSYIVAVNNEVESVTSDPATLTVTNAEPEAPVITTQPESQTVPPGMDAIFSVVATGTEPMNYQWLKDRIEIAGATSDFLIVSEVSENDAGNYSVFVSNEVGSTASDPATLLVADADAEAPVITTQPQSQAVDSGTGAIFAVIATGSEPLSHQWFKDGVMVPGATGDMLVLREISSGDEGTYTVRVSNDVDSVESNPATLTVNDEESEAPVITMQPQSQTVAEGDAAAFNVFATGGEPLSYRWFKDGMEIPGAVGESLVIHEVSDANQGVYTVLVSNDIDSVMSDSAMLMVTDSESEAPVIVGQPQSQAVTAGATVIVTVMASGADPLHYQWFKNGAELAGVTADSLIFASVDETDAASYAVLVSNEFGSVMSDPATLTVGPANPGTLVITLQPASQTVAPGASVTLSVIAAGDSALGYQWFKDGIGIEGATADALVLTNFVRANVGSYSVLLTNQLHSVTSEPAVLSLAGDTSDLRIAWISSHRYDEAPTPDATATGMIQAPDIGYTQVLTTNGHKVTRVLSSGSPNIELLNTFDLIVISGSVPGDDYREPTQSQAWNGIATPTIIMGGQLLRTNGLGFVTGTSTPVTTATVSLTVTIPDHPIFKGIDLDENRSMVNPFANLATHNDTVQRGISVNTEPIAGVGTILATVATTGDPAFGGVVIGEWQAGTPMGNAAADTLGGHRLVFLSGSGEPVLDSQAAGIFDLTDDGVRMFLNAVKYMAEPKVRLDPPVISNGVITITWSNRGTLETATAIEGEWLTTGNDTGSHTEESGAVHKFYRVRAP